MDSDIPEFGRFSKVAPSSSIHFRDLQGLFEEALLAPVAWLNCLEVGQTGSTARSDIMKSSCLQVVKPICRDSMSGAPCMCC